MFRKVNITKSIFLLVIISLSALLNFYRLGEVPTGLYVDEASNGYNAYSLLLTGKDEYGKAWPAAIRFLGSYSPPLYSYLTMLPVGLFGLNVWSVRAVSAVCGVLGVLVIYLFLSKLFVINKSDPPQSLPEKGMSALPYVGALVMAVSPWNVFFARAGYEIYLGALLFWAGAVLVWVGIVNRKTKIPYFIKNFVRAQQKNKKTYEYGGVYMALGLVVLSLATYGAHTERYLAPLLVIGLLLTTDVSKFKTDLSRCLSDITRLSWRSVHLGGVVQLICKKGITPPRWFMLGGLVVAFLIQIPNFYLIITPAWWHKNSLFYSDTIMEMAEKYYFWLPHWAELVMGFLHKFWAQYLTYFSPRSLFYLGDPDLQRSMPELSVFYGWMVVPYLIGLYILWQKRRTEGGKFLWLLLLLTPLPAALTNDPFSTQRALPLAMPIVVVISLGINYFIASFNRKIVLSFLIFLFFGSLFLFWRSYFILLPVERAGAWNYGLEELADEIIKRSDQHFVIDQSRQMPMYIGLAFFMNLVPEVLQASVDQKIKENYYHELEFDSERSFANLELRGIDWEEDIYREQILVGDGLAISDEQADEHALEKVFEVLDLRGAVVFRGFTTNPIRKCESSIIKSDFCGGIVQ